MPNSADNSASEAYAKGAEARSRDDLRDAERHFRRAAEGGLAIAVAELAYICRDTHDVKGEKQWLEVLDGRSRQGDAHADFALYWAYNMYHLGVQFTESERELLAREHLHRAAERGAAEAQVALAYNYKDGLLGERRDLDKYEIWINKAIEQNYEVAVCGYAEHLLEEGQPLPSLLENRLRDFALNSPRAARALSRLKRQNKAQ